ncbi:uncharacterized protein LOC110191202 [Drosophila serrata]|uniref:uncharacterized protein LOC110191202 n=1 Tax=Drosophila serrata TaxID=7274 RepID=UPI000A1D3564|nr:uncharacterized protein LOC110191202 [Drosophila serrata]
MEVSEAMTMDMTPTSRQDGEELQKTKKHSVRRHSHNSPKALQRTWLKRRLRRLVTEGSSSKKPMRRKQGLEVSRGKANETAWYCLFLVLCLGLGLTVWRFSPEDSSFWEMYNNQYHSIVHNRTNYCDRSHQLGDMVTHCRRQVLHQEEALDELERALDNTIFQNIALVGSSGVGKRIYSLRIYS